METTFLFQALRRRPARKRMRRGLGERRTVEVRVQRLDCLIVTVERTAVDDPVTGVVLQGNTPLLPRGVRGGARVGNRFLYRFGRDGLSPVAR
jgi:hypothetical protein